MKEMESVASRSINLPTSPGAVRYTVQHRGPRARRVIVAGSSLPGGMIGVYVVSFLALVRQLHHG